MKSENLNFLEPCGPLQACNGTDLPLVETVIIFNSLHSKNGYANSPECYVIRIFPVLLGSENTCDIVEWICTKSCYFLCVYLLNGSEALLYSAVLLRWVIKPDMYPYDTSSRLRRGRVTVCIAVRI